MFPFKLLGIKLTGDNLVKYAQRGDLKAVRYLIQKEIHPDTKSKGNESALNKAIQNRHWKIARLLIENGVTMPPGYINSGMSLLHWAAREGLYGYAKSLIEEGADVNACDKTGQTPLMVAAGSIGHKENREERFSIFKMLLDHPEIDIHATLKNKRNVLMAAAWVGHAEGVRMLLERGVSPSIRTTGGNTAFKDAKERNHKDAMAILKAASRTIFDVVESGNAELLKSLLASGEDVEQQTQRGYTPIMLAAWQNEAECIDLLSEHGANVNAVSNRNRTALDLASEHGCLEAVIRLLKLCAEVNTKTTFVNTTPLMHAAGNGHEKIVELLLVHNADPTIQSRRGWTAAHYAADGRYRRILKLLESKVKNINKPDEDGTTPLMIAAKVCDRETLKDLLSKLNKDESIDELSNALVYATSWDEDYDTTDDECLKTTKMIIDHQPSIVEIGGLEALKRALNDQHIETARLLIDHGVNVNDRDENGYSLLMHAVEYRSPASVQLLLSLGVDQGIKNREGMTALDIAKFISKKAPKDAYP